MRECSKSSAKYFDVSTATPCPSSNNRFTVNADGLGRSLMVAVLNAEHPLNRAHDQRCTRITALRSLTVAVLNAQYLLSRAREQAVFLPQPPDSLPNGSLANRREPQNEFAGWGLGEIVSR